eukprot:g27720.t1
MQWFLSKFILSSSVTQDSVLYSLFPGTRTETNISCAWRTVNAVKDTLWSARNLLVFQLQELTPTVADWHIPRPRTICDGPIKAWGSCCQSRVGRGHR